MNISEQADATRLRLPPEPPLHAQRIREGLVWLFTLAVVCVAGGTLLRSEGISDPRSGATAAALFGALGVWCLGVGIRQRGTAWWTTPACAAIFAVIAGWSLVLILGPGSGTAGACEAGEDCGMSEGIGLVFAPAALGAIAAPLMITARAGARVVKAIRSARGTSHTLRRG